MNTYLFLTSIFVFALGLFSFFCVAFNAPSYASLKHTKKILNRKPKQDSFNLAIDRIALTLARLLPFSKYRIEKTQAVLYSADISVSPQLYLSRCITKALLLFAASLLAAIIFRPMLLTAACIPLLVYASELKKAGALTVKRKEALERDLPSLVSTISAELPASRDILRILKRYSENCSSQMQSELRITIADMESGSYETALSRMEIRCNSVLMCDMVRGLIGTVRGNDEKAYFKMLSYDMKQWEQANLKKQAQKCVPKLSAASMILMISIIGLLVGVLMIDLMQSSQVFF